MFYKYVHKILFFLFCILFLTVTTVLLENISYGVPNPLAVAQARYYKDTTTDVNGWEAFNIDLYLTTNTGWCPPNHVTDNCDVPYDHQHVLMDWPQGGHDANDAKYFFDFRWEAHDPCDSYGTADPKTNCFSYAFDINNIWVMSPNEILDNDYNDVNALESDADICFWTSPKHICKITDVCDCNITEIMQKEGGSAIFTFKYTDWDKKLSPWYTTAGTLREKLP